jgi:hypothetical protein
VTTSAKTTVLAMLFASAFALALVAMSSPPVAKPADAHAIFTCKHGDVGHWTWGRRHEVRYQRHFWRGGRHYHVYHYYKWTLASSWVYIKKVRYDCTGAHSR